MKGQTEIIGLVVVVILLVVIVLIFLSISSTKEDVIREDIVTDSTLKVVMRYSVPECNGLEISRLIANPMLCGSIIGDRDERYRSIKDNYIIPILDILLERGSYRLRVLGVGDNSGVTLLDTGIIACDRRFTSSFTQPTYRAVLERCAG